MQKWKTTNILGPQGEREEANYVRTRSNSCEGQVMWQSPLLNT